MGILNTLYVLHTTIISIIMYVLYSQQVVQLQTHLNNFLLAFLNSFPPVDLHYEIFPQKKNSFIDYLFGKEE